MSNKQAFHPVIEQLLALVEHHGWKEDFVAAVESAMKFDVPFLHEHVRNYEGFLKYMNDMLHWVPFENYDGKEMYNRLCTFYFIFDQPSMKKHQNSSSEIASRLPGHVAPPLCPLSKWFVDYANAMGQFMDTPESLTEESLKTFEQTPYYNLHEYIKPRGGWKTFNQFFARNFKPGYRPIAAISDQTVIVSPADSTFAGQWEIRQHSQVIFKTIPWYIDELLQGSPYKDRFVGGLFMHAFLNTHDYHRQHAPVGGTVLEARVIQGLVYLEVTTTEIEVADETDTDTATGKGVVGKKKRKRMVTSRRTLDAPDHAGYQFAQTRGLIVLDTPIGLVAILPIGMAQVSSVVITAEVGVTVQKGEEISYFQFGGSDIVMLFERKSNVSFTAQAGVHYKVGTRIAQAYPAVQ